MSYEVDNRFLFLTDEELKAIRYSTLTPNDMIKFRAICQIRASQLQYWELFGKLECTEFTNLANKARKRLLELCVGQTVESSE